MAGRGDVTPLAAFQTNARVGKGFGVPQRGCPYPRSQLPNGTTGTAARSTERATRSRQHSMASTSSHPESYLVIGGCGFLGRHIVEQLLARGETQVAVFDQVQRHFDSNVTFYIGDITNADEIGNALAKSHATVVFHTASPVHGLSPAIYEKVNVVGTQTVIDACQARSVPKLVYTSSAGVVYSGTENIVNVDERIDYPAVPLDAYNDSKAKAEYLVLQANGKEGVLTCALRPAGIFGPGDRQGIVGFMQVVDRGQTKWQIGQNDNLFDWTYVVNVAHAHLLAADKLGSTYPLSDFRLPLDAVNLSVGQHTIPTSYARPLGPNVEPSAEEREIADRFARGEKHESDVRPVLRTKMDQFAAEAALDPDTGVGPTVAGQAFFITNCEPYYFWDHAHTMWKLAGHVPPYLIRLPEAVGLLLGTLAEAWAKLSGKEAGFTRFRVTFATQKRFYDVERARRLLGYTPIVGVEEGLKKTVEWWLNEKSKTAISEKS